MEERQKAGKAFQLQGTEPPAFYLLNLKLWEGLQG